jgi:uncharacterized protein YqgV (UPF0045/DUF77 family)
MKRLLVLTLTILLAQSSYANCKVQAMLTSKIEKQLEQRNTLIESLELNKKLETIAQWPEWSNVQKEQRYISMVEAEEVFTAKEIDILLLTDILLDQKGDIQKGMTVNVGLIAGSLTTSFITHRIINKLLRNGYSSGFMRKVQQMINSNGERTSKAKKIKMVAGVMSVMAPAYLGYKTHQLYTMLEGVQKKLEVAHDLELSLPEIEILDERIETDRIMLRKFQAENEEECF